MHKISRNILISFAVSGNNKRSKSVWRKLVLLMWKNLLLRRRHWLLTTFEILLPTLLFTLLVTIRILPDSIFIPAFVDQASLHCMSNDCLSPATSMQLFSSPVQNYNSIRFFFMKMALIKENTAELGKEPIELTSYNKKIDSFHEV